MANGYFRNQLSASSTTLCSGLPLVDVLIDTFSCNNVNVNLINQTGGSPTPTYSWSAVPAAGVSFVPGSTDPNPSINFSSAGVYTVNMVATNSVGVNSFYTVMQIDDCTGLKDYSDFGKAVSVSPNPSSGVFTLKAEAASIQYLVLTVYNSLGQLVVSRTNINAGTSVFVIDLGNYPQGVYTLNISNGKESAVKRLILTK